MWFTTKDTKSAKDGIRRTLQSRDRLCHRGASQTLTYMKLGGVRVGLLINFNVSRLKDGIKRFVL